jgi:exopolysaccharide biosynthesis polyprenyl glycosylphosphotransferase
MLRERLVGGRREASTEHERVEPQDSLDLDLHEIAARASRGGARPARLGAHVRGRAWREGSVLLASDAFACALTIAVLELTLLRFKSIDLGIVAMIVPATVGWALLANIYGLYDRDRVRFGRSAVDDLPDLLILSSLATWFGILILNATDIAHPRLRNAAAFWFVYLVLLTVGRAVVRLLLRSRIGFHQATLIVGAGRVGQLIAGKLVARPQYGLDVVGFLDDDPVEMPGGAIRPLGRFSDLERVVNAHWIERVIVAFSRLPAEAEVDLCRRCQALGVRVDIVPRMYEVIGWRNYFRSLDGMPLVGLNTPRLSAASQLFKRCLDLFLAGIGLVLLSPLFLYCALRIKADSPGPVFFGQERVGVGGRRFKILKFRTMNAGADARKGEVVHLNKHTESGPRMFKIADDPRITPFGRFMRRWSLDELPQLINVMRGEMSLVGPRPLILDEDEQVLGQHRKRLDLTPGMTGLWQVLGRSDISFTEMVALDYLYVTNWSLWGDIKLLSRTFPVVLQKKGAY